MSTSQWKIEESKRNSKREEYQRLATESIRRGDYDSARHYADQASKLEGAVSNQARVSNPDGWKVVVVPNTPNKDRKRDSKNGKHRSKHKS